MVRDIAASSLSMDHGRLLKALTLNSCSKHLKLIEDIKRESMSMASILKAK